MNARVPLIALAILFSGSVAARQPAAGVLITGARIVDGTGEPERLGSVRIEGAR